MKSLETKELEKLTDTDLVKKLNDLRSEFSKLKSGAARGTLKKELGEIKTVRRNIARVLTAMSARKVPSVGENKADASKQDPVKKVKRDSSLSEESKTKE